MQFRQPGPWLFAIGMIGVGAVALWLGLSAGGPMASYARMIPPVCLIAASAGLLFRRTSTVSGAALFVYWIAALVLLHVPGLLADPDGFEAWVSAAQVVVFAAVAVAFVRPGLWPAARVVLGGTVLLFGVVHLSIPGVVSDLLPHWFPVPDAWPYVTGAIQIAAGGMILLGFRTAVAAFVIGLMWLSWILLVHAPRLFEAPGALFMWTFMFTTVALAGAAWSVGERIASQSGEDLQPSAH